MRTMEKRCIPMLKFEQKCQLNEAERGQKRFSMRMSCPAFQPRTRVKPGTCPIAPFLLHIWASHSLDSPGTLGLSRNNAGCSFACIRYRAPLQSRALCQMGPTPRPVQPADNLRLICNCCANKHFLSLMNLAASQGSTQKGPGQWM